MRMRLLVLLQALLVVQAAAAEAEAACADQDPLCPRWTEFCTDTTKYPCGTRSGTKTTSECCRKSCNACPQNTAVEKPTTAPIISSCKDESAGCTGYSILCGEDNWVDSNCKKTCGKCPSTAATTSSAITAAAAANPSSTATSTTTGQSAAAASATASAPAPGVKATVAAPAFKSTGKCVVSGACVSSPNFPQKYGDDESCTITAMGKGKLTVNAFDTEKDYDKLKVGAITYMGLHGPQDVAVTPATSIKWSSDHSGAHTGWKICIVLAPTPTPTPTPAPTAVAANSACPAGFTLALHKTEKDQRTGTTVQVTIVDCSCSSCNCILEGKRVLFTSKFFAKSIMSGNVTSASKRSTVIDIMRTEFNRYQADRMKLMNWDDSKCVNKSAPKGQPEPWNSPGDHVDILGKESTYNYWGGVELRKSLMQAFRDSKGLENMTTRIIEGVPSPVDIVLDSSRRSNYGMGIGGFSISKNCEKCKYCGPFTHRVLVIPSDPKCQHHLKQCANIKITAHSHPPPQDNGRQSDITWPQHLKPKNVFRVCPTSDKKCSQDLVRGWAKISNSARSNANQRKSTGSTYLRAKTNRDWETMKDDCLKSIDLEMKTYRKLVDDVVRKTVAAFRFKVSQHLVSAPGSGASVQHLNHMGGE